MMLPMTPAGLDELMAQSPAPLDIASDIFNDEDEVEQNITLSMGASNILYEDSDNKTTWDLTEERDFKIPFTPRLKDNPDSQFPSTSSQAHGPKMPSSSLFDSDETI